ncbi:MAG TPA: hypothetical protein VM925_16495 [Labilithrix sp.]|nr:hypothetical protein [Labilithrix sp.]
MRPSHALASCFLVCLSAACSGAPSESTPDYELTSAQTNPARSTEKGSTDETPSPPAEDAGTLSSSSSSSSSGSSSSGSSSTVGVMVDGQNLIVGGASLWAEVSKPGDYDLFVKVSGAGIQVGSDIHVKATASTAGCASENYIDFRPANDTQYMAKRGDAACGLSIVELPTAVGGHFKGSFDGILDGINSDPPKSKRVVFTFDIIRTK